MKGTPEKLPIKTDLFSFVTFRSPEHLKIEERNIRFVIDNNFAESKTAAAFKNSSSKKASESFENKMESLSTTRSYQEVRNINPSFYDFANKVFKNKSSIQEVYNQSVEVISPLNQNEVNELFQQLYYQIFTQQSNYVRQGITQMIIVNHTINNVVALAEKGISKLTDIKIEINEAVIEQLKREKYAACGGGTTDGVQSLGIADFRRVEQEVCCYVPGEVSHIENVMAKEFKERATRNFVRTENTIETSRETEIENLTDVTTSTRNEINTEVATVLEQDRSSNYGGSMGVTYAKFNINAFANFANNSSSSYSNSEAKTYAEDVTKRALERVLQKTSEKRTSKIIKEFEESNKHGFDNRNGDKHITGIYRWIDIIYKNRLINYGKRLMVEFMVPEPAAFYKTILKYVPKDGTVNPNQPKEKPKSLPDFAIDSKENITRENYSTLATYYNVTIDTPLEENKNVSKSILPPMPPNSDNRPKTFNDSIVIEPFYEADNMIANVDINYTRTSGPFAYFKLDVGGLSFALDGLNGRNKNINRSFNGVFATKFTNTVDINFDYRKLNSCTTFIEIRCRLTVAKFDEWQEIAYQKLQTSYKNMMADYNTWLAQQTNNNGENKADAKRTNPAMNRLVEQRELKRICIEMIMKPFCREQGKENNTEVDACKLYKIPQVNQNEGFTNYTNQVKFFEQAIDWQIMSYLFYAYYWVDKCDWGNLMQSENEDLVFQAFLQSGMARVVVPIRQQFTEAFSYYLQTGDIWLGNDLVAGDMNDLYLSIAEEMQTTTSIVEEEWETRVPTSLAIIQGKSAFLEEEGLPCCNHVENSSTTTNIFGSGDTLQIINP